MLHFNNLRIKLSTSGMLRKCFKFQWSNIKNWIMDQFFWALPPNLIKESYTGIPKERNRVQSRNIKTEPFFTK